MTQRLDLLCDANGAGSARILIVEDEPIVARDIAAQICDLGYQVAGHTRRGEDAIDMARSLQPDLVLMDIQLAG